MILLKRTDKAIGSLDGSPIVPAALNSMALEEIRQIPLEADCGTVPLYQLFDVSQDRSRHESLVIVEGDCHSIDGLGQHLKSGTLCVLGDVGDKAGAEMQGGELVILGNARDRLGMAMSDGLIYLAGNARHGLAAPIPGKKSGMRGGDIVITGNVGDRACERMRRGTVFVAGDAGDCCAPQMIAGSLIVMGQLGCDWGGGMRRGSLILGREVASVSSALLSEPRDFELSFLPLIWKHIARLQCNASAILNLSVALQDNGSPNRIQHMPLPIRIPSTRWVQRRIADLSSNGQGEVLVLKRVSSLSPP